VPNGFTHWPRIDATIPQRLVQDAIVLTQPLNPAPEDSRFIGIAIRVVRDRQADARIARAEAELLAKHRLNGVAGEAILVSDLANAAVSRASLSNTWMASRRRLRT